MSETPHEQATVPTERPASTPGTATASRSRFPLPTRLPAPVQWLLLVLATAILLRWVGPEAVESPYNGF